SPKWDEALEEGLARIEDETRRDRLRARLEVLFEARTDGDSIPVEAIRNRLDLVRSWLGGNRGRVEIEAGDVSVWDAAMVQCCSLRELLDACGDVTVSQYQLQRLLREATRSAPVTARHEQKAGLTFLSSPSDLLEPCPTVVWWRFGQNSAPRPSRLALRSSEVSALGEAGVAVADPGQQAQRQAIRWGHPLVRCTQRLLLVCPRTDESGEAQEPHPLWDEIRARVAKGASIQPLEVERPSALEPPEGVTADLLALPAPQRSWEVPSDRVFARESGESPSSLETLLGCSLHWVLKYCGGIRAGSTDMLSSGKQLLGSLAHKLIARVLEEKHWTDSSAAGARFEHTFDHDGPKIAASLFGPEHNSERARTRILGRLATVA
ncbi:MAG: PD-(D/E)XK nuclease family protein, partial [Myxococcota bacterium]|nr:PD-(D/E)XK nuclease family protein [Myxococcota bacterium]